MTAVTVRGRWGMMGPWGMMGLGNNSKVQNRREVLIFVQNVFCKDIKQEKANGTGTDILGNNDCLIIQ